MCLAGHWAFRLNVLISFQCPGQAARIAIEMHPATAPLLTSKVSSLSFCALLNVFGSLALGSCYSYIKNELTRFSYA